MTARIENNPIQIWTDVVGLIVRATPAAGRLLNTQARGMRGRELAIFFDRDRGRVLRALDLASRGHAETLTGFRLRPKERATLAVTVIAERDPEDESLVRWTLERSDSGADGVRPPRGSRRDVVRSRNPR